MALVSRIVEKARWTRPLPQVRVLRAYGVSPLRQPRLFFRYALHETETSNFTYDIANEDELVEFVAVELGESRERIAAFLSEIAGDDALARLGGRRPRFGRRLGWYAIVRATAPRLVVETGTADGLGTALLARAVLRNAAEGNPGEVLSFDVDPAAGRLLPDELGRVVRVVIGDAVESLPAELADRRVDVFIHDSLHTYDHERRELELALEHGSGSIVLISDNAHVTTALKDTAEAAGASYGVFRERPLAHFYPGAGLGVAIVARGAHDSLHPGREECST